LKERYSPNFLFIPAITGIRKGIERTPGDTLRTYNPPQLESGKELKDNSAVA